MMVSNPSRMITQHFAAMTANMGVFAAGCTLGWSSPVKHFLMVTSDNKTASAYDFEITSEDFVWITSLISLGAAASCPFFGAVCQVIGRKLTMLLLVIPFTIGWALVTFPMNVMMLIAGRFLLGLTMGAFCVIVPIYTAEIADPKIRGTLGSYFELFIIAGAVFPFIIGAFTSVFTLNLICATIPIIFGIIFLFMPESPLYLISKGHKNAAIKSWKWLRGDSYDYSYEMNEFQEQIKNEKREKLSLVSVLTRRSTIKSVFISWGLCFFQQTSGITAIVFFTHYIFESTGSSLNSNYSSIVIGSIQFTMTILSTMIVDKLGRRLLLMPSCFMMSTMTFVLGTYFYLKDINVNLIKNFDWIPIVSLCVYTFSYAFGIGPIAWLIMGEIFPNDIKSYAGSLAATLNWTLSFVVASTFIFLNKRFGIGQTFWIYSAWCLLGTIFVFFIVPETKGKSLVEIQRMLEGNNYNENINQSKEEVLKMRPKINI